MIRNKVSVLVLAVKSLTVITVLKSGGKKLDNHCVAVTLVAAESLADTAESCQRRCAVADLLESHTCVALNGITVNVNNRARMNRLVNSFVVFDLTVLSDRGCAVDNEIEILIGRDTDGQRICAEHTFNAEGRSNGRTCVCTRNADAACLCRHCCVISCNTVMAGIADCNHTHSVFLSLFDSHFHRLVADNLSHSVVTVNNSRCRSFLDNFKVCYGILNTCVYSVDVNRLKTVAAVGLNSPSVRFKNDINDDLAVLLGNADTLESVNHKIVQCFPITYNFTHNSDLLF